MSRCEFLKAYIDIGTSKKILRRKINKVHGSFILLATS